MKIKRIGVLVFAAALLTAAGGIASGAEPPKTTAEASAKLVTAIEKSDYNGFVAEWGDQFKNKLKKEPFEATVGHFGGRLKTGYDLSYLGELKQNGLDVTLWKVSFKDNGDDALVTVVTQQGMVAGFWIK